MGEVTEAPPPLCYTEQRPPADLVPWVASFWRIAGAVEHGRAVAHRILPDGCADIVFDLEPARRPPAHRSGDLVGPMSSALVVALEGRIDCVGVRLRPGTVGAFAGLSAVHLRDFQIAGAEQAFPLRVSAAQLASVPGHERLALLIAACRERAAVLAAPDPLVRWAIELWHGRALRARRHVSDVARDVALSERAFERRFVNQVGLTPVHYRRLARFRSALVHHGAGLRDWAELAAAAGFSDQAHLTREFRSFSGLTPTDWACGQGTDAGFVQDCRVTTF